MSTKDGIRIPNWVILILAGILIVFGLCCWMSSDFGIGSESPVIEGPAV